MSFRLFDDATHHASRSGHVLVVDDDEVAAVGTVAALAVRGYRGSGEADGDAALRHVRAALVQLVVSELYVVCAEGPCVVTVLRADRDRLPLLRVLVYTRHDREVDVEWALSTGCDALVLKSAEVDVLLREVGRLDGSRQSPRQN
jgi:DNA-binding NarL/FixJ family response regulator